MPGYSTVLQYNCTIQYLSGYRTVPYSTCLATALYHTVLPGYRTVPYSTAWLPHCTIQYLPGDVRHNSLTLGMHACITPERPDCAALTWLRVLCWAMGAFHGVLAHWP